MRTQEYLNQDTVVGILAKNETWHLQNTNQQVLPLD